MTRKAALPSLSNSSQTQVAIINADPL